MNKEFLQLKIKALNAYMVSFQVVKRLNAARNGSEAMEWINDLVEPDYPWWTITKISK